MVCSQTSTVYSISRLSRRGMVLNGETSHQVSSRCYRNGGDTLVPSHPGAKGSQMALENHSASWNCRVGSLMDWTALAGATGQISSSPCSWFQVQLWHSLVTHAERAPVLKSVLSKSVKFCAQVHSKSPGSLR